MAQRLHPLNLVAVKPPIPDRMQGLHIDSNAFQFGWSVGIRNTQPTKRYNIDGMPTENGILDIVRNLNEMYLDNELTDEQLRYDVGVLVGYVCRLMVTVE
jgi:hypothetical protein